MSLRVWRWAVLALAVPVGIKVADTVAEHMEAQNGPNHVTRALRVPGRWRRSESLFGD